MNCSEAESVLQRQLDGEAVAERAALDAHVAACPGCRERFAAADRLTAGLRRRAPAVGPADLTDRIVARVREERRRGRHRRFASVALASGVLLAASVLLALGILTQGRKAPGGPPAPVTVQNAPSVQEQFGEAGQAVVALTRRTADETVGRTRWLLPEVPLPAPPPLGPPGNATSEAAERSLREVRQGVSAGLEPVTTSARRAVSLFLRELPAGAPEPKSGS